jgi:hypothetical protein
VTADAVQPLGSGLGQVLVYIDAGDMLVCEPGGEDRAAVAGPGAHIQHVHAIGDQGMPRHLHDQAGQRCRGRGQAGRAVTWCGVVSVQRPGLRDQGPVAVCRLQPGAGSGGAVA